MIGSDGISSLRESLRRILSNGIYGIILLLLAHPRSAEGYDAEAACRVRRLNVSTGLYRSGTWSCGPPWTQAPHLYCCGTDTDKYCCAWTTYVINVFGAGSTGLGVGLLVGLGFMQTGRAFTQLTKNRENALPPTGTGSQAANKHGTQLAAFVIFLLICLIFRRCVVARWTASELSSSTPRKRHNDVDNVAV